MWLIAIKVNKNDKFVWILEQFSYLSVFYPKTKKSDIVASMLRILFLDLILIYISVH